MCDPVSAIAGLCRYNAVFESLDTDSPAGHVQGWLSTGISVITCWMAIAFDPASQVVGWPRQWRSWRLGRHPVSGQNKKPDRSADHWFWRLHELMGDPIDFNRCGTVLRQVSEEYMQYGR